MTKLYALESINPDRNSRRSIFTENGESARERLARLREGERYSSKRAKLENVRGMGKNCYRSTIRQLLNDHRYEMIEDVIGYRNRLREKSRERESAGGPTPPRKTRTGSPRSTLKMQRRVRRTRPHFVIPATIGAAKLLINCSPGLSSSGTSGRRS